MNVEIKHSLSYYREESLNIIPLKYGEKKPVCEWKEYQQRKITKEEIKRYFSNEEQYNIGIVCGEISDNLFVIDIDREEIFSNIFKKTEGLVIVKTGRGYHVYFKANQPVKTLKLHDNEGIEVVTLKGEGSYVVAPPSKHAYGTFYHFIQSGEIPRLEGDPRQHFKEQAEKIGLHAPKEEINIEELLQGVPEGNRDNSLTHLIHFLRRADENKDKILKVCQTWNKRNKPPLSESNIKEKVNYHFDREPYNYYYTHDPGRWTITEEAKLKEKKLNDEKGKIKRKAHLEKDGKLYLEVLTTDKRYKYAYQTDSGDVELVDSVDDTLPVELPITREGELAFIVKMPDENIASSKLLTPDELLEKIESHVKKYCDLPKLDVELCSYYALFSWFYKKCNTVGYLRFLADTGKGKSRMLTVVGDLSFYPTSAGGSSSFSGMMRTNEQWHGTLVMDEADVTGDKESSVVKYLNSGFEQDKYFILSNKNDPSKQEIFNPYSPKIIGMRERFRDNATEGRLLSISPNETTDDSIQIILDKKYHKETGELRNEIARFVLEHWQGVDGENMLSFKGIGIEPRLQQLAMPLSIVFQLWDDGEERFREYIRGRQKELKKDRAQSWYGSMFNLVYSIAVGDEELNDSATFYDSDGEIQAVTPSIIAKAMNTSAKTVTDTLRSIGFEVELRYITDYIPSKDGKAKNKKKRVRSYVVPDERTWREIIQRYYFDDSEDGNGTDGTDGTDILTHDNNLKIPNALKSHKYLPAPSSVLSVPSVPNAVSDSEMCGVKPIEIRV